MSVTCELCFHHCHLEEGQTGFCRARICRNGAVVLLNYGKLTSLALDPIEKKPLRRFHPGSLILSVGSFGCNLRCPFCQNHEISMAGEAEIQTVFLAIFHVLKCPRRSWPLKRQNCAPMGISAWPTPTTSRW